MEGRRRRGQQKMRWLDGIPDSMNMNLSKLQQMWRTRKPGESNGQRCPAGSQSMGLQAVRHKLATKQQQHVTTNMHGFDHSRFQKQWKSVSGDTLFAILGFCYYTLTLKSHSACFFSICLLHWKANFSQQRTVTNYARSRTVPAQCEKHYVRKLHVSGWTLEGSSLNQRQADTPNWRNLSRPYVPYFQTTQLGRFWLIPGCDRNCAIICPQQR